MAHMVAIVMVNGHECLTKVRAEDGETQTKLEGESWRRPLKDAEWVNKIGRHQRQKPLAVW